MKLLVTIYCALAAISYVNAVFNGKDAKPHSAPFIVNMRMSNNTETIDCNGAIISKNAILTTTLCANFPDFVTAGQHSVKDDVPIAQKRTVVKVVRHPGNLDGNPFKPYNFAILFLNEDLVFNEYVQSIELPEIDQCASDDAIVFGWGRVSESTYPDVLQQAVLPLISRKVCNETVYKDFELNSANICTGSYEDRSVDFQDHGAPLIQFNKLGVPQLIGIVSYPGNPPSPVGKISVFGNVAAVRDFIDKTLMNN